MTGRRLSRAIDDDGDVRGSLNFRRRASGHGHSLPMGMAAVPTVSVPVDRLSLPEDLPLRLNYIDYKLAF